MLAQVQLCTGVLNLPFWVIFAFGPRSMVPRQNTFGWMAEIPAGRFGVAHHLERVDRKQGVAIIDTLKQFVPVPLLSYLV